jgi:hypothetical protein
VINHLGDESRRWEDATNAPSYIQDGTLWTPHTTTPDDQRAETTLNTMPRSMHNYPDMPILSYIVDISCEYRYTLIHK